jgi:hypothetical protein
MNDRFFSPLREVRKGTCGVSVGIPTIVVRARSNPPKSLQEVAPEYIVLTEREV